MQDYSTFSEDQLVRRLRFGDEFAFTEIYNRYWEKLLAIGYSYTEDRQTAQDIVHEVMMSLWSRKADMEIRTLQAYLATAVKFAVFKAIARDKRRRDLLEGITDDRFISDIEEKLDARFLEEYIQGIVEEMPEKTRLIFIYSRSEEFTISEIAGKMNLSPKAIEYHITKALRSIRQMLGKIKSHFI